eukprot:6483908-Amphidinium_carterae.1
MANLAELKERQDGLEDTIDDLKQDLKIVQRRSMFNLFQQHQQESQKCRKQLVFFGFRTEDRELSEVELQTQLQARERTIQAVIQSLPNTKLFAWTNSHQTSPGRLSRVSIVTFREEFMSRHVFQNAKGRNLFQMTAEGNQTEQSIRIKPQLPLFERLTSVPIKAALARLSGGETGRSRQPQQQNFRIQWQDGEVFDKDSNRLRARWNVHVEDLVITILVPQAEVDMLKDHIENDVNQMIWQHRGKQRTPSRLYHPASYDSESDDIRCRLNQLSLYEFPFYIRVRALASQGVSTGTVKTQPAAPMDTEQHHIGSDQDVPAHTVKSSRTAVTGSRGTVRQEHLKPKADRKSPSVDRDLSTRMARTSMYDDR